MNLEGSLVEKLRKLEALHAGTTVDGERDAAQRLEDLTDRVIREAIHADVTEPAERDTKALPGGSDASDEAE